MDEVLILLGLGVFVVPIAILILLVGQSRLKRRVGALERALSALPIVAPPSHAAAPTAQVAREMARPEPQDSSGVPPQAVPASQDVPAEPVDIAAPATWTPAQTAEAAIVSPWERARKGTSEVLAIAGADRGQDQPIVMRRDRWVELASWLKVNWVYAISALSLALAGIFFVQYGMENGYLTPERRVVAAILFGGVLVGFGEWLRRRHGDDAQHSTVYLPSVFSGAGLVSIFAAIVAARQMYGMIGSETAFAGLLVTAAMAVGLGWFHGPLLEAIGLLGAAVSPFIVAGQTQAGPWLYAYFALVGCVGLAVDAVRRWAWVSVLALVLAYGSGGMVMLAGAGLPGWIGLLVGLSVLAAVMPTMQLVPRQDGPATLQALVSQGKTGWPAFPVRLAAGAALVSTLGLTLLAGSPAGEAMLALVALALMALAYISWAERADGLVDLAYLPALAFLISIAMQGFGDLPLHQAYLARAAALRPPEVAAPMTISLLLAMAALIGAGFAWRSFRAGPFQLADTVAAALIAPVSAATLDLLWDPSAVIGPYSWALQIIALAAAMAMLSLRYAARDGNDRRRFAYATLSSLSLIALALFLVATSVALTVALSVLVVVAAGLDRRFNLPEMRFFIQIGAAVLWYRLFGDPGIDWAMVAPIGQVIVAFLGAIAAFGLALRLLESLDRPTATGVLESAAAGLIAVLLNILLTRWLIPEINDDGLKTYWGATINAMPWSILMLVQIYRLRLGGPMRRVRQAIAMVAAFIAGGGLLLAAGPFNPLFVNSPSDPSGQVDGHLILDSLALAYALPGLLLLAAGWKLPEIARVLRLGFLSVGSALMALFVGLEIRRYWQGDWLGRPAVVQGELYNYTVALMLIGAGLLYLAIVRRSGLLRRIAMAVIALTVVKVFLLDASGLTGLTRVASFLGLGLSLAGLAWLNRWAGQVSGAGSDPGFGKDA